MAGANVKLEIGRDSGAAFSLSSTIHCQRNRANNQVEKSPYALFKLAGPILALP